MIEEALKRLNSQFDEKDEVEFEDERGDGRHFRARIVSDQFEGLSRVKRHQKVYKVLEGLIGDGKIHAIRLDLKTHSE